MSGSRVLSVAVLITATLKDSSFCKLATVSGRAIHSTMASGKMSTYNSSCLFESDEMS